MAKQGNGLGENKVPAWNPKSVGDYKRGLKDNFKGNVEGHDRKGAGQKAK